MSGGKPLSGRTKPSGNPPCILANATQIAQVPGRKTDVDAAWIAQLLECGLIRASFVPPPPIRELRDLTRYRKLLIQERTRHANRLHKILEDAGIKLTSVATRLLGTSGRAMLDALVTGTTDSIVLADLARGKLRKKLPALRQALLGHFRAHHAFLVSQLLAHLDYLDEAIETVSTQIDTALAPFARKLARLDTHPQREQAHRRGAPRRARPGHARLSHCQARRQLGRPAVPATTRARASTAPAGLAMATAGSGPP